MIFAAFPYQKQRRRVLSREIAYVEVGEGPPSLHCARPDRHGDSDKLPDSGPRLRDVGGNRAHPGGRPPACN